jgi:hypothetical protein
MEPHILDTLTSNGAVAFVLGALSPPEREQIDRQRLFDRQLDDEIAKLENCFAPMMLMESGTSSSSHRLDDCWQSIISALSLAEDALRECEIQTCSEGDWSLHGPGIETKYLWHSESILIRCNPGAVEEAHQQPEDMDEHILVIAGDLEIGGRRFLTGDYLKIPAGSIHAKMQTSRGCLLFTEYLAAD